jgi:hypothetical protein
MISIRKGVNKVDIMDWIEKVLKVITYSAMAIYWIRRNLKDKNKE